MNAKKRLVAIFTVIMLFIQVFHTNIPIGIAKASSESSVTTDETGEGSKVEENKLLEGKTEEDSKAEQDDAGEGKTEQDKTGEDKTGEGKTEQDKTEQDKVIEVGNTQEDNTKVTLQNLNPKDITKDYKFITDVKITDSNGGELGNKVGRNSEIRVEYTWSIPDNHSIKSGDYYTMNLPKEVEIISAINQPLISNGEKIADLYIGKDGSVKITFTSFVENSSGINGGFYAQCDFNEKEIGEENPVVIKFFLQGGTEPKVIEVNFDQPVYGAVAISKSGKYDTYTNEITWTVLVNNDKKSKINKGAIIIDDILKGQVYVEGSASINGSKEGFNYSLGSGDVTGTLKYEFSGASKEAYTITYKTKPNLSGKKHGDVYEAKNTVTLDNKNGDPVSVNATVNIPVNYIKKEGSYNSTTRNIDWKITVNSSLQQIDNAIIIDKIPDGLEIEEDSIKIDGNPAKKSDISITNGILEYRLGIIGDEHIITFSTKVVDPKASDSNTEQQYENTATLKDGSDEIGTATSNGIGIPTSVIKKQGAGYNAQTHEITWKVIINGNKIAIKGAVVKDDIPIGQEYVEGSFAIDKNVPGSTFTYDNTKGASKTGSLKYEFSGEIKETYTITFKTKVTNKKIFGSNETNNITNIVVLTGEGVRTSSSTGTQRVASNVITKTATGYDYVKRIISWKVVINNNKMLINNAVFKDNIPKGHKYVEGSFAIDGGLDSKKVKYEDNEDIIKSGTLTYKFEDEINKAHTITFQTEVTDITIFNTNSNVNVKNISYLTGDEVYEGVKGEGTQIIKNQVISKTSQYTDGNDYIVWKIRTTSNFNIPLKDAVIEDILQKGLELQTDTIKLKKLNVDSNGTLIEGDEVPLTKDNIKYDVNTRKFEFKFTGEINGAFELSFTTVVTQPGSYSNTATFKGSVVDQSSGVKSFSVRYSTGGGWAEGKTGSIKILKVDEKDEGQKLKGAVFNLLDQYDNVVKTSNETGDDGAVLFDKIKFNVPYFIKEVAPPNGYELSKEVYEFTLKNEDGKKDIVYNFKNSKVKGTIEFTKIGEDSKGLKEAEFALYDKNDTEYTKSLMTSLSDEKGVVRFENVDYGEYTIKEIKAPLGYNITDKVLTASIPLTGGVVNPDEKTISNTKIKGDIEFVKKDENGTPLKGAEFKIYKKSDKSYSNPLMTSVSDVNGIVELKNIEYGEYNIKETKSPTGYYVSDKTISVTIEKYKEKVTPNDFTNNKIVEVVVPSDGIVKLKKVNEVGEVFKGAEFSLIDNKQNIIKTTVSDENGRVEFKDIPYGKYKVKETKSPIGYNLLNEVIDVEVSEAKKVYDIGTVRNTKIKANIEINKVDDKNKPLKGAEFTLYSNGQKIKSLTSDSNGLLIFENVEYGDYVIKETKAPSGYRINNDEIKVSVRNGETQKFTVENIYRTGGSGGSGGGEEKPSDNGEKPGDNGEKPGDNEEKPSNNEEKPGNNEEKPSNNEEDSNGGTTEGITDSGGSGTSGNQGESTTTEGNTGKNNIELQENTSNDKSNIIPKTGGSLDSIVLLILGLVPIIIGSSMFIKIRKRENN